MPRTTYHVFQAHGQDDYGRDVYSHEASVEDAPSARKAIESVKGDDTNLESYYAVPIRNWTGFKVGVEPRMVFEAIPDKPGARVLSLASAPEEDEEPEPEEEPKMKADLRRAVTPVEELLDNDDPGFGGGEDD